MIPVRVPPPQIPGIEYDYNNSTTLAPPPTPVSPNSSVADGGPSFQTNVNHHQQHISTHQPPAPNGRATTTGALTPGASTSSISVDEKQKPNRFHIIKINTGPCKRGRWICTDTDDQAPSTTIRADVVTVNSAGSNGSSGRQSYHGLNVDEAGFLTANHEPSSLANQENDVPTTASSSRFAQSLLLAPQAASTPFSPHSGGGANSDQNYHQNQNSSNLGLHPSSAFMPVNGVGSSFQSQNRPPPNFSSSPHEFFAYPQPGDVDLTGASAVLLGKILPQQSAQGQTSFDGSTSSSSGTANCVAIDNKIEQAMDLVKTHLLYAVREEVEILKVRIVELEKKVGTLEKENKILREYAPPEILAQLTSTQTSSSVVNHPQSQQQLQHQLQLQQQHQLQLQSQHSQQSNESNNSNSAANRTNNGPLLPKV